jgi:hypothetical protein
MKSICLLIFVFAFSLQVQAQRKKNQIGLRLGDPIGLTYKTFLSERSALQFGVGTAASQWNPDYYRRSFDYYFDENDDFEYVSHTTKDVLYLQARYVIQKQIIWNEIPGRFDWYWGVGVLGKRATINYEYVHFYNIEDVRTPYYEEIKIKDYDLGPESIIGVQYTFKEVPLSIDFDVSVLVEFHDRRVALRGFTALGFLYNF